MKFKFKAIKKDGEIFEDTINVKDKFALFKYLKGEELTLISTEEIKENRFSSYKKIFSFFKKIKTEEKIMLARNLGAMIKAGLSLTRAISIVGRQTKNTKMKKVLKSIESDLGGGDTFSSALSKFPEIFPQLFISMVGAGEESGDLSGSLKNISEQMERSNNLRKKIKGAMIYPSIIIVAMIIIGILMLIFVVPTLTSTFEELGADLPFSTQVIITISELFKENTFLMIFILIFISFGGYGLLKTKKGKHFFDYIMLKIPLIKELTKEINSARTTGTLSTLLSSGVDVVKSLEITKNVVQNSFYKKVIETAQRSIQKGAPISQTFKNNENLYPAFVGEMISVGEETGQLPDLLMQVANFYEEEVERKTKNMSTIIEPLLMIIVGAALGFFAISMITPMYSLTNSM
ncbi:type II secretion system F family protein [Patescibacteria group bacterium]|nr:type II secretion system F family protein [Patescibacteria group bacterium]MBU4057608.1 type II secretion system F family protein [Patescibacteria group bacterium]MBU4115627.1 type II secretion system F family protein [Patescibacteria group bacterium]